MTDRPPVTVVVPAFNAEEWIGDALASVVAQTYPKDRLDVVVVDDGCTDRTVVQASGTLSGSGIAHTVLRNASAQGPSAARNRGWRHAAGPWIQFLDADDVLAPAKIETQIDAIGAGDSTLAALFSPWARLERLDGRWSSRPPVLRPRIGADALLDLLRTENFMQLGSVLFARSWLTKVDGFLESSVFIEDVELLMRIILCGGMLRSVPAPAALSWYRQRPASLSRTDHRRFIDGCMRNARAAESHWASRGELTAARAAVLADIYFMAARYYAERDPFVFRSLAADLERLVPGFTPTAPSALRLLTRILGYPRAERVAVSYRRVKRSMRFASLRGLPPQPADRITTQ